MTTSNDTTIQKVFVTTREAAVLLGVSVGTVQHWVEGGVLQAWKTTGGHRRVLRDSVELLLHKHVPATPPSVPQPLPAQVVEPIQVPAATSQKLKIMVVDDNPHLLQLYRIHMARWEMKPEVVALDNAIAALLQMGRSSPDLLITDLRMPGMDGYGMLQELCKTPDMARTTMVVVTGLDMAEVQASGRIPPGIDILPKPIPFARLEAIARATLMNKLSAQRHV